MRSLGRALRLATWNLMCSTVAGPQSRCSHEFPAATGPLVVLSTSAPAGTSALAATGSCALTAICELHQPRLLPAKQQQTQVFNVRHAPCSTGKVTQGREVRLPHTSSSSSSIPVLG